MYLYCIVAVLLYLYYIIHVLFCTCTALLHFLKNKDFFVIILIQVVNGYYYENYFTLKTLANLKCTGRQDVQDVQHMYIQAMHSKTEPYNKGLISVLQENNMIIVPEE